MASSCFSFFFFAAFALLNSPRPTSAITNSNETKVLQAIVANNPAALPNWLGDDPCGSNWEGVTCKGDSVTQIVLKGKGLTGALPSFTPLSHLTEAYISGNGFTSIPADFFVGLSSLEVLNMEDNPLLNSSELGWQIPDSLAQLTSLQSLYMTNCSLVGAIPPFLGNMTSLQKLRLSYNKMIGGLPASFYRAGFEVLVLNQMGLEGPIDVVGSMPRLQQLWLHMNSFTGTIPAGLALAPLVDCQLNNNNLVGEIPPALASVASLKILYVQNNKLVGKIPSIPPIDNASNYTYDGNSFCTDKPGEDCALQTTTLLAFLGGVSYPATLLSSWTLNNPCLKWTGIICNNNSNVVKIALSNLGLSGSISSALSNLTFLTEIDLSRNNLTGVIPNTLTTLKFLITLDVSNNSLLGPLPSFPSTVKVITSGNPNFENVNASSSLPSFPSPPTPSNGRNSSTADPAVPSGQVGTPTDDSSSLPLVPIVCVVVGVFFFVFILGIAGFFLWRKKQQRFNRVQSPNTSLPMQKTNRSNGGMKVTAVVGGSSSVYTTINTTSTTTTTSSIATASSDPIHTYVVADGGSLVISIQVLRSVTNGFSDKNILGRGGFGVVYKGELDDGTIIAVKRMEIASAMSNKGLKEFQAEIDVLSKVRHRNLVSLLGYCIEDNEKLLVYEYMPLGTLSEHIFEGQKSGFPSMSWNRRLSIALDVARGIEYLHSLAHQSFIHRDLKPSNILLGDNYRAKVSDFGLVKLAPEGKFSIETRLAGTFGYLAPEYAVTGRVTTKVDVFSFGVILMELITGRRAIDDTQPEETAHLVTWFRRTFTKVEAIAKVLDPVITAELSGSAIPDETLESICKVAELAGHCTAREPHNRPDMGHAVGVLSLLLEAWTPSDSKGDDDDGIDLNMTLPQALKKWQALGGSVSTSSDLDMDNTQSSLPARPAGFADSFTSSDGR